jgi:hypothetical protein
MAQFKSLLACVIVIADVRIIPQFNEVSEADFAKLNSTEDFKDLLKDDKIQVVVSEDEDDNLDTGTEKDAGVEISKMKNAELWKHAESLGIEIPAESKRADVLKLIQLLSESDD